MTDVSTEYRDRPLGFHWRTPLNLVEGLGLPKARSAGHDASRCAIIAEAILAAEAGQGVSYSRRKSYYAAGKRYRGTAHTYGTVLPSVAELSRDGWLTEQRVDPNSRGWQSSFRATPDLVAACSAVAAVPVYDPHEPIRLKDCAGNLIDYSETRETLRLRRQLEAINAGLSAARIEIPGAARHGRHLRVGDSYILPVPGNGLQRIFSRGKFSCHGRAYGWWQNTPKTVRCGLTIDGEATAEADYTALHASILYGERGIKFDGDPYDVGRDDIPRDHIKLAFNIAVNARNHRAAVAALADKIGKDRAYAADVLAAMTKRHAPIHDSFFSDAGVRLMRIDSEMILHAMRAANDDGIVALPVHDALIAPAKKIDRVEEKMAESFEKFVGSVNPCQIKIKGQKVPHMGERASSFLSAA